MDTKELIDNAYKLGWIAASRWGNRMDLLADIDSPAYLHERDQSKLDLVKQLAEALEKEVKKINSAWKRLPTYKYKYTLP